MSEQALTGWRRVLYIQKKNYISVIAHTGLHFSFLVGVIIACRITGGSGEPQGSATEILPTAWALSF